MSIGIEATIGTRMSVKMRVGDWSVMADAGDDYEGGLTASAKITRVRRWSSMARVDELTWLGVHAANGKHSRWMWYGVAGQRMVRGWRVAWWLPKRHDSSDELPPRVDGAA
jgi:hypothetical protein